MGLEKGKVEDVKFRKKEEDSKIGTEKSEILIQLISKVNCVKVTGKISKEKKKKYKSKKRCES